MNKINAKKARKDSIYYKEKRESDRKEIEKMEVEDRIFAKIRENVLLGRFQASFSSREEEGRYIRKEKELFKNLGYELSFYVGTSTLGDVKIDWRNQNE